MPVPVRILGNSGTRVSALCLGTMMFGEQTDEATATRIIDHAAAHGINFIDTADAYANAASEEVVGRAIRARRNDWIVATKVGNAMAAGADHQGQSRIHVMNAAEASLRRLGTDHIDLYYLHVPDAAARWENIVETYGLLIRQGKIREWGLSNVRGFEIAHAAAIADRLGVPRPVAIQPYYNLMNRQPEVEVLPAARQFGLGVVPYSPLARGVLSGKYRPGAARARHARRAR